MPHELFAKDYLATYAERDVRLVRNIQSLPDFQRFLKLCAGRAGQLLNLASLAHGGEEGQTRSVGQAIGWRDFLEKTEL